MSKKTFGILAFLLLLVGVVVAFIATQQSTENRQHASAIFTDVNSAADITAVNNADGTMGPPTWVGNFSNTLPVAYLGTLSFRVTDPEQGQRPTTKPTHTLPTQAQGNLQEEVHSTPSVVPSTTPGNGNPNTGQQNQGGPQTVTSLTVVINKVEVHLARLGVPGAKNLVPTVTPGKRSVTPGSSNQNVDKWETLNIGGSQTVDLVALAKTHNFIIIGLTKLTNGFYTEVRLYISSATAVLSDGTKVTLTIPGRANIVRVVEPFTIDSGATTTLTMDFDAQNSVLAAGKTYLLKPVVARFDQSNQE